MESPNGDDALDSTIASLMKIEPDKFLENLLESLKKNAIKDAAEWYSCLMGNAPNLNSQTD
jgi:hypothetical protein